MNSHEKGAQYETDTYPRKGWYTEPFSMNTYSQPLQYEVEMNQISQGVMLETPNFEHACPGDVYAVIFEPHGSSQDSAPVFHVFEYQGDHPMHEVVFTLDEQGDVILHDQPLTFIQRCQGGGHEPLIQIRMRAGRMDDRERTERGLPLSDSDIAVIDSIIDALDMSDSEPDTYDGE